MRVENVAIFPAIVVAVFMSCTAVAAVGEYSVSSIEGTVLVKTDGDEWSPAVKGDSPGAGSELRVLEKARLFLESGCCTRVAVSGSAKIIIAPREDAADISTGTARLDLEYGTFAAMIDTVKEGAATISVKTPLGSIELIQGVSAVATDGRDVLKLAAGDGRACLLMARGERKCVEGDQAIFVEGPTGRAERHRNVPGEFKELWQAAGWPVAQDKLSLTVFQPADGAYFGESNIIVRGRTTPGAKVTVNNTESEVGSNGGFSAKVSLYEGENHIVVEARNQAGETSSAERRVFLDSIPPILTISQPIDNFDPTTLGTCNDQYCSIQIFGLTEPGVQLEINDIDVSRFIEDDGSFIIQDFPLRRDRDTLRVEVSDPLGQRTVEILHISEVQDSDYDGFPDDTDACPFDPLCQ